MYATFKVKRRTHVYLFIQSHSRCIFLVIFCSLVICCLCSSSGMSPFKPASHTGTGGIIMIRDITNKYRWSFYWHSEWVSLTVYSECLLFSFTFSQGFCQFSQLFQTLPRTQGGENEKGESEEMGWEEGKLWWLVSGVGWFSVVAWLQCSFRFQALIEHKQTNCYKLWNKQQCCGHFGNIYRSFWCQSGVRLLYKQSFLAQQWYQVWWAGIQSNTQCTVKNVQQWISCLSSVFQFHITHWLCIVYCVLTASQRLFFFFF